MASINYAQDSRSVRPILTAGLVRQGDGTLALTAPTVGLWRAQPPIGALIAPGGPLGHIELLGVLHELIAPAGAHGVVTAAGERDGLARRPVAFGDLLVVLSREALSAAAEPSGPAEGAGPGGLGLVVRAPSSGRYYARPAPGKPAFVSVGEVIEIGKVVGLLEVMKTFTRIHYGGGDLPPRARITALYAEDEADVAAGEPLLAVEPESP